MVDEGIEGVVALGMRGNGDLSLSDGDGIELREAAACPLHGLLQQGVEDLHVGAAGHLGHDPAILLVEGHLG